MISKNVSNDSIIFTESTSEGAYFILGTLFILIEILAIPANGMVFYVFMRNNVLLSESKLVFMLCVGDLLTCVVGLPMVTVSAFANYWVFRSAGCNFYGVFMTFLGCFQITLLSAIAISRYYRVVKNRPTEVMQNNWVLCFCFCYTLVSVGPVFGWGSIVQEATLRSCGPKWESFTTNDITFNLTLFVLYYAVPVGVITFSYASIYRTMKRGMCTRRNRTYERQVTNTILLMIVSFLVSWTPYAVISFYSMVNSGHHNTVLSVIALVMAKSTPIWNPYIYFIRTQKFREVCLKNIPFLRRVISFSNLQHEGERTLRPISETSPTNTVRKEDSYGELSQSNVKLSSRQEEQTTVVHTTCL